MSLAWNTTHERQTFAILLQNVELLLDSSDDDSISLLSFEDELDEFMDDDDDVEDDEEVFALAESVLDLGRTIFQPSVNLYRYGRDILIDDLPDNNTTVKEFRFRKNDLTYVGNLLWPKIRPFLQGPYERISVENGNAVHFETGFLVLLYRLMYPTRIYPEMVERFLISSSRISYILKTFVRAFYLLSQQYFSDITMWRHHVPYLAQLVRDKLPEEFRVNVWGFVDGTLRETCKPTLYQREFYSGHKKKHGYKMQSIYLSNGMYGHIYGPEMGSRHDSAMMDNSGLRQQLEVMFPRHEYQLYGDAAYHNSGVIYNGFQRARRGVERHFNHHLSRVRMIVEWGFNEVTRKFGFIDFSQQMKLLKMPVVSYFVVSCFFLNIRTCLYGNETTEYFGTLPMDLEEYLNLPEFRMH